MKCKKLIFAMVGIAVFSARLQAGIVPLQESAAFQAFLNGDYLQAIELANANIRSAEDRTPYYFVLGASNLKLDKFADAELYLKQASSIVRGDERMKQSARMYLSILREAQYESRKNSKTRSNFAQSIQDFLRSDMPTFLPEDQNRAVRKLANDELLDLMNISGEWRGTTIDDNDAKFVVEQISEHQYRIIKDIHPGNLVVSLSGSLNEANGTFSGVLKHTVLDVRTQATGVQNVTVTLRLSEDTAALSGTADYDEMRDAGSSLGIYPRLFKPQTTQFKLTR